MPLRTVTLALSLALAADAASAAGTLDVAALADDLAALAGPPGAAARDASLPTLQSMADQLQAGPELARALPAALAQGAALARRAENPASRAVFYDLTRAMLMKAASMTEGGDQDPMLAAWNQDDPLVAELVPGQGLAQSDLDAMDRLTAMDPAHEGIGLREFWDSRADKPINRLFPTRLDAWSAGAAAAWDDLDAEQRQLVLHALDNKAVPPAAVLEKVIGTPDMLAWLAAVKVPMSDAERAASPELVDYMERGAFAGPALEPLRAIAAAGAAGANSIDAATAQQLMRLNNWASMHGEMHSTGAYGYMMGF